MSSAFAPDETQSGSDLSMNQLILAARDVADMFPGFYQSIAPLDDFKRSQCSDSGIMKAPSESTVTQSTARRHHPTPLESNRSRRRETPRR